MAEDLKTISAPALTTGYGQDIKDTFTDIDKNFKILDSRDINKGDSGTGVISLNIPFSELLKGDNDFETAEGLWFHGQRTNFTEMFKKVKKGLTGEDPEDTDVDVARSIECLEESERSICVLFDEPAPEDTSVIEIKTTIPYVFKDDSFIEKYNSTTRNIEYDLSGVISYNADPLSDTPWNCDQLFPTLYYDSEEKALYWVIDGSNTTIPAQGVVGKNGLDGKLWIGLVDTTETPITQGNVTITQISTRDGWKTISELVSTSSPLPTPGSPIVLLPEYIQGDDSPTSYAIATVIVSANNEYTAILTDDNILYAKMTSSEFINCMTYIKDYDATDNREIPGYFFKNNGSDNNGYIFFRKGDQLTLRKVTNVNDPTNTGTSGEFNLKIDGDGSLIVGGDCNVETAVNAVATGLSTTASGDYSHAEGDNTTASGYAAHAEGSGTTANNDQAHAEGESTTASGIYSHAEGESTTASGYAAHAEGESTTASGYAAHAEGHSTADGQYSHAEGYNTETGGNYTSNTKTPGTPSVKGDFSHAEGNATIANGYCSHSEGKQTLASGNQSHAEGERATASGTGAHAEGNSTTAEGNYSHAEGDSTTASGDGSHAEGKQPYTDIIIGLNYLHAGSSASHPMWYYSVTTGNLHIVNVGDVLVKGNLKANVVIVNSSEIAINYNFGTGSFNTILNPRQAFGIASHSEGLGTSAIGDGAHAGGINVGVEDYIVASGVGSFAHGYADNYNIYATDDGSVALGCTSEGHIISSGYGSFAHGYTSDGNIIASGMGAHAEGDSTTASGDGSHAEGYSTTASGDYSHAEGYGTQTERSYEHADGRYNVTGYARINTSSSSQFGGISQNGLYANYLDPIIFSIGCGNGSHTQGYGHRTNAFFVTQSGRVWILNRINNTANACSYINTSSEYCDNYKCLNPEL